MVSRTSKLILVNAVKHTELHNRKQEEKEMWLQRHKESSGHAARYSCSDDSSVEEYHVSAKTSRSIPSKKNKWAAELVKYEEKLGDQRWGHGGYKELYPEEFKSSDNKSSDDSDCQPIKSRKKKSKLKSSKRKREADSSAETDDDEEKTKKSKKRKKSKNVKKKKSKKEKKKDGE